MIEFLILISIIGVVSWYVAVRPSQKKGSAPEEIPNNISGILKNRVRFYARLSKTQQLEFEKRVSTLLSQISIKGIGVEVDDEDRVLVAAGAIIPVFGFPEWEYLNLNEVLLYPNAFNENFETNGDGRNILGMVGWGYMNGTMTLSKPSLHLGFSNQTDKLNVGIHEFVHLIDKLDGAVDGVPDYLMDKAFAMPWLEMMHKEMERMREDESDINPYGLTNQAEFYSVASEYFFERPALFKRKHPKLYEALSKMFKQDPAKK